jgi:hypothetical protein
MSKASVTRKHVRRNATHQTKGDLDGWRRRRILFQFLLCRHLHLLPLRLLNIHLPTKLDRFLRLNQPRDIPNRQLCLSPRRVSCLKGTKGIGGVADDEDVLIYELDLTLVAVWLWLLGDLKEAVDGDRSVVWIDGFWV